MKALVTGGTGFVGGHLVEALAARGDTVTALVRAPGRAGRLRALGAGLVEGDLHDATAIERAAYGQDVVFHVAGAVAARNEAEYLRVNRDGTANVARAARQGGCSRLVLVSSLAAAGPSRPGRPLLGPEPPHPITAYGRSKLAGEVAVRESGLPFTILRPPIVYGPGDRELLRVFRLARRGFVPLPGGSSQELSAIHAADLAGALVAAASAPATVGGVYHASHPAPFTSGDLALAIGFAVGRRVKLVPIPALPTRWILTLTGAAARATGRVTVLNRDKAAELTAEAWTSSPAALVADTGWSPRFGLATGLADTVAAYRAAGWL